MARKYKKVNGVEYFVHPEFGNFWFKGKTTKRYHELQNQDFVGREKYGENEIRFILDNVAERNKRIAAECIPQEVYFSEYNNHECQYAWDDEDAWEICVDIFGEERCKKEIKRNFEL